MSEPRCLAWVAPELLSPLCRLPNFALSLLCSAASQPLSTRLDLQNNSTRSLSPQPLTRAHFDPLPSSASLGVCPSHIPSRIRSHSSQRHSTTVRSLSLSHALSQRAHPSLELRSPTLLSASPASSPRTSLSPTLTSLNDSHATRRTRRRKLRPARTLRLGIPARRLELPGVQLEEDV